jgi:hypothetical protein
MSATTVPAADDHDRSDELSTIENQPAAPLDGASAQDRRWRCSCGQVYRISGSGRHRIYWADGAPASDPVMDGSCVGCRRTLPGKQSRSERTA